MFPQTSIATNLMRLNALSSSAPVLYETEHSRSEEDLRPAELVLPGVQPEALQQRQTHLKE